VGANRLSIEADTGCTSEKEDEAYNEADADEDDDEDEEADGSSHQSFKFGHG
jgi:hypothetical protein